MIIDSESIHRFLGDLTLGRKKTQISFLVVFPRKETRSTHSQPLQSQAQNSLKHGTHLTSKLSHQNGVGVVLQFNHCYCYSNTRTKNGPLKSLFPSRFLPKTLQAFSGFPPQFRETIYLQGSCFQSPKVG